MFKFPTCPAVMKSTSERIALTLRAPLSLSSHSPNHLHSQSPAAFQNRTFLAESLRR